MSDIGHSQGILALAFWVGASALALTLLLLAQVLFLRALLNRRARRRALLLAHWRPLILQGLAERPAQLPPLHPEDFAAFALLWNHFHEVMSGVSRDRLNDLGYAVGLDRMAIDRLGGSVCEAQLLAILTLGHLGERRAWGRLVELAGEANLVVSITAARALVLIDADAAMPLLAPIIERRDDWPLATIGAILHEAGPEAATLPLVDVIGTTSWARMARLMRLLKYAHGRIALPLVRAITRCTSDPEVIAVCLQLIRDATDSRDPRDADVARRFLHADDWRVRVQAARALGKAGAAEDRAALALLLKDQQWWVRYRAAQSLLDLPGASRTGLWEILARQTDPFARDMLSQVLAVRYST